MGPWFPEAARGVILAAQPPPLLPNAAPMRKRWGRWSFVMVGKASALLKLGFIPGSTRDPSRDGAFAARWPGRASFGKHGSQDGSRVMPGMTPSVWLGRRLRQRLYSLNHQQGGKDGECHSRNLFHPRRRQQPCRGSGGKHTDGHPGDGCSEHEASEDAQIG